MNSLDIFVENLDKLADYYKLSSYEQLAGYLGVNINTLKCWKSKKRFPSLKKLDRIADNLQIKTCNLIKRNALVQAVLENKVMEKNDSRYIFTENLKRIFQEKRKHTWNEKVSLFSGFVGEDALKAYFKSNKQNAPTLKKLDDMAEALGIPVYKLIEEVCE